MRLSDEAKLEIKNSSRKGGKIFVIPKKYKSRVMVLKESKDGTLTKLVMTLSDKTSI